MQFLSSEKCDVNRSESVSELVRHRGRHLRLSRHSTRLMTPSRWMLGGLVAVALGLRLWPIRHGLPWVYNVDEELHFVPVAVRMFGGSFNPHYFENPPALTYLLYGVLRLRFPRSGFPGAFAA